MARNLSASSRALALAFVKAFPVTQQPPHTKLTSAALDKFGIGQGVYAATASTADLNESRNSLVSRLNNIGSSQVWVKAEPGFQVVVDGAIGQWMVKPSPVAMAHQTTKLPGRNSKTIANRAVKADRLFAALQADKSAKLTAHEKKALSDMRSVSANMAQLQVSIARAQDAILQKSVKQLAKKDPGNRLL